MSDQSETIEKRYLERGWSLFLTFNSSKRPSLIVHKCEFEGGRVVTPTGTFYIFSGSPPRWWDIRLSLPSNCEDPKEIGAALATLATNCGGVATLHYSAVIAVRLVMGMTISPQIRSVQVWALAGRIATAHGRVIPIGWSGRGNGLTRLCDKRARELLISTVEAVDQAKSVHAGELPAVLSPLAAAVILHEAVGHFAEAAIEENTDLSHRIGCRIASELFSLYDDPLANDGCAHYEFDDDGVACLGPTEVVHDGILIAQLHSLASAMAARTAPTANGRAASAWDIPIPRMSNLICVPGMASEEELLENLGTGLYIHQLADGFSLSTRIEARIVLAEWIKDEKRTGQLLTGGQVKEHLGVLTRAVEIGNNPAFSANALCGKAGQLLFDVGTCAPAIRFSALRVVL